MTDDGLPPLRDVIAKYDLRARKSLGQNFLLDLNLIRKIARAAAPLEGHAVIEIGPGPGGLTRVLLLEGAEKVIAVERDSRVLPALEEIAERWPGQLEIIEGDALRTDQTELAKKAGFPVKVVANLPYNIATPLLTGWLLTEPWPPWWQSLTLMFQREVADRITALPGSRSFGRLAVLSQWRARARRLFDIPPTAFTPPPKVTSSVVQITPLAEPLEACPPDALQKVTAAAFGQRRKMLRKALKSITKNPEALLSAAGLEGTKRAEELEVRDFCRLARLLAEGGQT